MKLKYWYREIISVGLINWMWFVLLLGRDEFHPSLNMPLTTDIRVLNRLIKLRSKAHKVDMALTHVKHDNNNPRPPVEAEGGKQ